MKGQASRFPEAASFAQVPMPNLLLLQEQARKENEALLKFSHVYSNDAFLPAEIRDRQTSALRLFLSRLQIRAIQQSTAH